MLSQADKILLGLLARLLLGDDGSDKMGEEDGGGGVCSISIGGNRTVAPFPPATKLLKGCDDGCGGGDDVEDIPAANGEDAGPVAVG